MIYILCVGISVDELCGLDTSSVALFPILGSARPGFAGPVLRWLRRQLGWWSAVRVCQRAQKVILIRPPLWAEWLIGCRFRGVRPRHVVQECGRAWQNRWESFGNSLMKLTGQGLVVRSAIVLPPKTGVSAWRFCRERSHLLEHWRASPRALRDECWPADAVYVVLVQRRARQAE
jgi:hypothetical protein